MMRLHNHLHRHIHNIYYKCIYLLALLLRTRSSKYARTRTMTIRAKDPEFSHLATIFGIFYILKHLIVYDVWCLCVVDAISANQTTNNNNNCMANAMQYTRDSSIQYSDCVWWAAPAAAATEKNKSTVFFPLTNRNEFSRMLLLFYTHTNTRCWPSPPTKHNQWYFDLRLSFRKCSHSLYSTPHEWYDDVVFYTRARNISYTQPAAHIVGEPVLFYF